MIFNAASWLRSLEDRSAALGSSHCELLGIYNISKSVILSYDSGVPEPEIHKSKLYSSLLCIIINTKSKHIYIISKS